MCFVRRGINNLYHFFLSHELSSLQLFFYGLKSPSFWLSKTALLASFGSDGGRWRFFKENECNQPARESVSYLPFFLVVFLLFRHVPPCNKVVALKWSLIWSMWSQNDRRWVAAWKAPRAELWDSPSRRASKCQRRLLSQYSEGDNGIWLNHAL